MKLTIQGAAQTVTGSKYLLEINRHRLLLECGLFQGKRQNTYDFNLNFDFDPKTIDAVILSHAHIDHSGNLPNWSSRGSGADLCHARNPGPGGYHVEGFGTYP